MARTTLVGEPERRLVPGERDFLEIGRAHLLFRLGNETAPAAAIKITGTFIIFEGPDEKAPQALFIQAVAAGFEQMLAKAKALVGGREIQLVYFTPEWRPRSRSPERGIAGYFSSKCECEDVVV